MADATKQNVLKDLKSEGAVAKPAKQSNSSNDAKAKKQVREKLSLSLPN